MKKSIKKAYLGVLTMALMAIPSEAFAGNSWGTNIKTWVQEQASAIAVVAVLIAIIPMIVKKTWALLVGTIFLSGIALYFVNNPDSIGKIGNEMYKIVFG